MATKETLPSTALICSILFLFVNSCDFNMGGTHNIREYGFGNIDWIAQDTLICPYKERICTVNDDPFQGDSYHNSETSILKLHLGNKLDSIGSDFLDSIWIDNWSFYRRDLSMCYSVGTSVHLYSMQTHTYSAIPSAKDYIDPQFINNGNILVIVGYYQLVTYFGPVPPSDDEGGYYWVSVKNNLLDRNGNILTDTIKSIGKPNPVFDVKMLNNKILSLYTDSLLDTISVDPNSISACGWSQDGTKFAILDGPSANYKTVRIYNFLPALLETSNFTIPNVSFSSISLSPLGDKVAIGSNDSIIIYNNSGQIISALSSGSLNP